MVEGVRLEIVWAERSRRFESSRFRQKRLIKNKSRKGLFLIGSPSENEDSLPLGVSTEKKVNFLFAPFLQWTNPLYTGKPDSLVSAKS